MRKSSRLNETKKHNDLSATCDYILDFAMKKKVLLMLLMFDLLPRHPYASFKIILNLQIKSIARSYCQVT